MMEQLPVTLQALISAWNNESMIAKIRGDAFVNSTRTLASLNTAIYDECKKHGIDIKTLMLN